MGQLRANGKMWRMKLQLRKRKHYCHTCGFIDNAKAESVNMILEYADKERGLVDKVFVTGCYQNVTDLI
jgi:ribosomal protein S12 methylthiotransferase